LYSFALSFIKLSKLSSANFISILLKYFSSILEKYFKFSLSSESEKEQILVGSFQIDENKCFQEKVSFSKTSVK
jgi:hypothetical protein